MDLIVKDAQNISTKTGRKPTSIEHKLGTEIWRLLEDAKKSVFVKAIEFGVEINQQSLITRLKRIGSEKEFSVQASEEEGVKGFTVIRIK